MGDVLVVVGVLVFVAVMLGLVVAPGLTWRFLGSYMADGVRDTGALPQVHRAADLCHLGYRPRPTAGVEALVTSLVVVSGAFLLVGYLMLRAQGSLPLDP
jgi:hypothetical protein